MEESLVKRALERIAQKIDENHTSVSERFLIGTPSRQAIPAELVPVVDSQHHISGFIFYIEDSSVRFQKEQEIFQKFQAWHQQLTQSISVIKATAELLDEADTVQAAGDRAKLIKNISRESGLAANILTANEVIRKWLPDQPWPLTPVDAVEWSHYLRHRAAETIGIDLQMAVGNLSAQISIDMHHLSNALLFVLNQISKEVKTKEIHGNFFQRDAWLYMDLAWHGKMIDLHQLKDWKEMMPQVTDMVMGICLGDILSYHGAKLWLLKPGDSGGNERYSFVIACLGACGTGQRQRTCDDFTGLPS